MEEATSVSTKECLLQVIGAVGPRLASHNAHLLMLAIIVLSLDSPEVQLRAAAAEVLAGAVRGQWWHASGAMHEFASLPGRTFSTAVCIK